MLCWVGGISNGALAAPLPSVAGNNALPGLIWEEGQVRRGISFFFSIDGIRENSIREMGIVALLEIIFILDSNGFPQCRKVTKLSSDASNLGLKYFARRVAGVEAPPTHYRNLGVR